MSQRAKQAGDVRREFTCSFCGGVHRRRSKEARECRQRARSGRPPLPPPEPRDAAAPRQPRSEITHYATDPLRGDKRAHVIAHKHRAGMAPRRIAKQLGLPLATVRSVIDKLEAGR